MTGLLAVMLGLFLGSGLVMLPSFVYLLLAACAGAVLTWWMFRRPHLTVTLFLVAFTIQSTIFAGLIVQGLYYPIYLLMLLNLALGLALGLYHLAWWPMSMYALFLGVVVLSLFSLSGPVDFELFQRIFIYALGLLTFFQFRSLAACRLLPAAQIAAALIVAAWVVAVAFQGGFAGTRVETDPDQNVVSAIIALGLIPLFARQTTAPRNGSPLLRLAFWLLLALGIYAMLLLASRGQAVALAMGLFVVLVGNAFPLRRGIPMLVAGGVLALVLINLPGSENLTERLTAADLGSANGRLPLWTATMHEVAEASPYALLFGHGFDSNKVLVTRVAPGLTSTHNSYLQILYEFGLVGLAFFLALHAWIIKACWRERDRLGLYALGAMAFLLFSSLSITATDSFLYWIVLGHLLAIGSWKSAGKWVSGTGAAGPSSAGLGPQAPAARPWSPGQR